MGDAGVYLSIVFTKTDKPRKSTRGSPQEQLTKALYDMDGSPWRLGIKKELPAMFLTSSMAKTGKEAVLEHIADLRRRCKPRHGDAARQRDQELAKKKNNKERAVAVGAEPPPTIR